jgi:hypothetical protein
MHYERLIGAVQPYCDDFVVQDNKSEVAQVWLSFVGMQVLLLYGMRNTLSKKCSFHNSSVPGF